MNPPNPTWPERHLGPRAAALLRAAEAAGEPPEALGAVRPACVLFADIRGFSRLAERVDLATLRRFLGEFVGLFVEAVEGEGGMANKFLGDGGLALFAEPPDAAQAARAALALHAAFCRLRERHDADAAFADLDLGLGLGFGEVFLGNIGAGRRFDYTAIGRPVNVAERLAAEALPGEGGVFCDGDFRARLAARPEFVARSLGRVRPRGMTVEIARFQLLPGA